MARTHEYPITTEWTGNTGQGTASYRSYTRVYDTAAPGKPILPGSADPRVAANSDTSRYNPEELLVASASACHMLWYLHLCADAGIVVTSYRDEAMGVLGTTPDGSGAFTEIVLRPRITLQDGQRAAEAEALHARAHHMCYVARSLKCPIRIEPETQVG